MKRKLRLTASACLLGCLVLLNACNDVKPSVDSDPVDTGTYSQESEDTDISEPANTTDTSHELPRGEIPFESVYIMGTYPDSDNPDLPDNIRYLDDTRNLKDTYTLDEAVQMAEHYDYFTKSTKDLYLKEKDEINKDALEILNKVQYETIKRKIKKEVI